MIWLVIAMTLLIALIGAFLYAEMCERKPATAESLERRLRYAVVAMLEADFDEYEIEVVVGQAYHDWYFTKNKA